MQELFPWNAKIILGILKRRKHYDDDFYCSQIKIELVIGEARYEIS